MPFVSKREGKTRGRERGRSNNGQESTQTQNIKEAGKIYTISSDNINKHINKHNHITQFYLTMPRHLPRWSSRVLRSGGGSVFPKELRRVRRGCVLMVLRAGARQWDREESFFGISLAVKENSNPSMSGFKGESIALYPLKTKAVWFAGSQPMFSW